MSIDRIGKAGGAGPSAPTGDLGPAAPKHAFEVGRTQAAEGVSVLSAADRVRSGEMSIHAYIEVRVNEATQHLQGKLSHEDFHKVQDMLRTQVAEDPAIQEMVRAASGALPPESPEKNSLHSQLSAIASSVVSFRWGFRELIPSCVQKKQWPPCASASACFSFR